MRVSQRERERERERERGQACDGARGRAGMATAKCDRFCEADSPRALHPSARVQNNPTGARCLETPAAVVAYKRTRPAYPAPGAVEPPEPPSEYDE